METREQTETVDMSQLKSLARVAGVIVAILTLVAGGFSWINTEFLRKESFEIYQSSIDQHYVNQEEKIAELIRVIEEDRTRAENEMRKMIKDSSALAIIIRRDFLLSRDKDTLTALEKAELNFLNHKLRQLNIER